MDGAVRAKSLTSRNPDAPLSYVDHFPLDPADLKKVLSLALSSGGDFAEIYMEHRTYDVVNME